MATSFELSSPLSKFSQQLPIPDSGKFKPVSSISNWTKIALPEHGKQLPCWQWYQDYHKNFGKLG